MRTLRVMGCRTKRAAEMPPSHVSGCRSHCGVTFTRQKPAEQKPEPKDNTLTMIVGKETIERIKSGEKTTFKRYLDDEEFAKEVLLTENGRIKLSNDHCPYTAKDITSVKLVCDGNSLVKPVIKITFRTGINQQGKTAWKIVFHF